MLQLEQTDVFSEWLAALRDARAKARIVARLVSVQFGNFGDVRAVGDGISELRVDVGQGYRAYFVRRRAMSIVLLCGGNKSTQPRDIARAKRIALEVD